MATITDDGVVDLQTQPLQSQSARIGNLNLHGTVTGPGELQICSNLDWQTGSLTGPGATILYNTGAITKTSGSGQTEIDPLLFNQGQAPSSSSGHLVFAGENLSSTPPNQAAAAPSCSVSGGTLLTGFVNLLNDPIQVIAGDTGADCLGGGTASGSAQLLAGPYAAGTNGAQQISNSASCGQATVCNIIVGATLSPGDPGYLNQATGAAYSIPAQFSYSPQGGSSPTDYLSLPPGTSPTSPLPVGSQYGGNNPASPSRVTAMCGDPVVCATGDQTEQQVDLSMGGTGGGFQLVRSYNSQLAVSQASPGAFGYGWTGPFDAHLTVSTASQTATVQNPNGSTAVFSINPSGSFSAPPSVQATLSQLPDGGYAYVLPDQETMTFTAAGNVVSHANQAGHATSFVYNDLGQVSAIAAPSGRQIAFAYNPQGLVASASDPAGLTVSYAYDASENLTNVSDSSGVSDYRWQLGYDAEHELTSMTDANQKTTTIAYSSGKVVSQSDPMNRTTTWTYGPGETDITLPNLSTTRELFDANSDPIAITRGLGTPQQTTQTDTYNAMLEPVRRTDGDGQSTTYGYDPAGNRTSETDPAGNTTYWSYDSQRDVTSVRPPSGEVTTYAYTAGNLTSVSRPVPGAGSQTQQYSYQDGNVASSTDPRGKTTNYGYNDQGDLTSQSDPESNTETWTYDLDGRVHTQITPRGNALGANPAAYTTTSAYDAQGRLHTAQDPNGHVTTYDYDADGNASSVQAPGQQPTTTTYNADGQTTLVIMPGGITKQTSYNPGGQVGSQTSGSGDNTISYIYNALGQVSSSTDADNHTTSYGYDADGSLTSRTNAAGTTDYGHDPNGRVRSITYETGRTANASFSYNPDGTLNSMSDATGTSSYTYDALDRLTSTTNGAGQTIGYGYDLANNQTSLTYPDQTTITRTFTDDEQLHAVTDAQQNTTTFADNPDGELQTTTFPVSTGNVDTSTYDQAGQLSSQQFTQNSATLASLTYVRKSNGQLNEQDQTGLPGPATTNYAYNAAEQLVTAGAYSYDNNQAGNVIKLDSNAGYSYTTPNQLTSSPTAGYSYNNVGERTSTTPTTGPATSYSYDQAGRLTAVTPTTGNRVGYAYDANGTLASRTTSSATTQFAWDKTAGIPLLLTDGTIDYIYGPDGLPIEQVDANGTPTYLHHDQLGSTRLLTNSTGSTAATYTYNPYGTVAASTGSATTPLGYAGQYTDPATSLQYEQARFYDSATGQFLTTDPLQALTGQPYAYANGDPVNAADPTGLVSLSDIASGIAGFGDTLTSPLSLVGLPTTQTIRQALGWDNVNYCSGAYSAGGVGALAATVLIPGEGDGELAAEEITAAEDTAGGLSRLVIGRTSDLTAPGALQPGEYTLLDRLTPNLGSPRANWARNSTVLRQELRSGVTQIGDASPGNTAGQFLNAERNVVSNRGWTFDSGTGTWNAP